MSRVGKVPVSLTQGAKVEISGLNIKVHGTKGTLEKKFLNLIKKNFEVRSIRINSNIISRMHNSRDTSC